MGNQKQALAVNRRRAARRSVGAIVATGESSPLRPKSRKIVVWRRRRPACRPAIRQLYSLLQAGFGPLTNEPSWESKRPNGLSLQANFASLLDLCRYKAL